jgi:hypothetical protein
MSDVEDTTIEELTEEQTAAAPSAPGLSIQDLIAVHNIIRVVSNRGAIQPNEMTVVGAVYDRLTAFLVANGAVQTQPAPVADEPAVDNEAEIEQPDGDENA